MSYLGRQPISGNFQVLDALVATTTDTYALTKDTVAVFPQTPSNCIVSLNGVIQAPVDSYTISGSDIVFASALTGSDSIDFITVLGDVLSIGTPTDGTVSLAKLSATGTKDATTFLRGDNTFQTIGVNTPAFVVYTSGNAVSDSTLTKITMNNEILDTDGLFDSTTNYRFTPNVAGKYFFTLNLFSDASATSIVTAVIAYIYKNGSAITGVKQASDFRNNPVVSGAVTVSTIIDMNGSTDYVEFFGQVDVASGTPYFKEESNAAGYKLIE
jgi:hypothetical protein